jgi:RNA polymerase sigma factor (sigma-70 family)
MQGSDPPAVARRSPMLPEGDGRRRATREGNGNDARRRNATRTLSKLSACNQRYGSSEDHSERFRLGFRYCLDTVHSQADRGGVSMRPCKLPDTSAVHWDKLMAAALAGDAHAYRSLLVELVPWLRRYYQRRVPPMMVEDLVQDVLLAVHEKRHTYDPSRPFGPWLAAIARYKWIDRIRSVKWQATEPLDESFGTPDHECRVVAETTLSQLLSEIRPAQAQVIRLVKIEGYSLDDAARATGQSVALVKVNIHRGLKRLAAAVQQGSDED